MLFFGRNPSRLGANPHPQLKSGADCAWPASPACPFFQRFFASFFGLVFCRFLAVPGLILGAILPPFSTPKSDLFFDWFFNRFLMICWWILAVMLATCLVIFTSSFKLSPILKTLISHREYCKIQGWVPSQRFKNRYKTTSSMGQKPYHNSSEINQTWS